MPSRDLEHIDAFLEGREASEAGRSDLDNPFDSGTDHYLSWNDGWNAAAEEEEELGDWDC
jgi:hypothetical protein